MVRKENRVYIPSGGKEEFLCPPLPQLDYLSRIFFAGFTERGKNTCNY